MTRRRNFGSGRGFITEWVVAGDATARTITLPLTNNGTFNCQVSWGDGTYSTISTYDSTNRNHTYSVDGTYRVEIIGDCPGWSFQNVTASRTKIRKVVYWGDVSKFSGFDRIIGGFRDTYLESLGEGSIILRTSQSLSQIFYQCYYITALNGDLFRKYGHLITDLNSSFQDVRTITYIPTGFFDNCINVTQFGSTFRLCTNILTLPVDLFRYCTSATLFASTFVGCTALGSLPENLFYYNSLVTSYQECFRDCRNIALPSVIFNLNNLAIVTSFNLTFKVTSTSYSPTGVIQDIWNYATLATKVDCFQSCINISNYSSIPVDWT